MLQQTTHIQTLISSWRAAATTIHRLNPYSPEYYYYWKVISQLKRTKENNPKIYSIGQFIGDISILTNQEWQKGVVFAIDEMRVISVSMQAIDRKLRVNNYSGIRDQYTNAGRNPVS